MEAPTEKEKGIVTILGINKTTQLQYNAESNMHIPNTQDLSGSHYLELGQPSLGLAEGQQAEGPKLRPQDNTERACRDPAGSFLTAHSVLVSGHPGGEPVDGDSSLQRGARLLALWAVLRWPWSQGPGPGGRPGSSGQRWSV